MAEDPVLLITGASSGIGAATAHAAADSHRLVLAARREDAVRKLAEELGGEDRALVRYGGSRARHDGKVG